jgi:serine/threonine protein kinase
MPTTDDADRSITIKEVWVNGASDHLCVTARDGFNMYVGKRLIQERRTIDNTPFENMVANLRPIPKEHIYPEYDSVLTRFDPGFRDVSIFYKAPSVSGYMENQSDRIATTLLEEARIHEAVSRSPHRNLGVYLGCVVDNGRVVRLAFRKYTRTLYTLFLSSEALPPARIRNIMQQVKSGATHLHTIGLAHNDISPSNIMLDSNGDGSDNVVLIDLDCCRPLGQPIACGGVVAGWRGPLFDNGKRFNISSAECDSLAIQYIETWLEVEANRPAST